MFLAWVMVVGGAVVVTTWVAVVVIVEAVVGPDTVTIIDVVGPGTVDVGPGTV